MPVEMGKFDQATRLIVKILKVWQCRVVIDREAARKSGVLGKPTSSLEEVAQLISAPGDIVFYAHTSSSARPMDGIAQKRIEIDVKDIQRIAGHQLSALDTKFLSTGEVSDFR